MNYDRWLQLADALSSAPARDSAEHDWFEWLEPVEPIKAASVALAPPARSQHVSEGSLSSLSRSPDSPGASGPGEMGPHMQPAHQVGYFQVSNAHSTHTQEAQQAASLKSSLIFELCQPQELGGSFAPGQSARQQQHRPHQYQSQEYNLAPEQGK